MIPGLYPGFFIGMAPLFYMAFLFIFVFFDKIADKLFKLSTH